MYLQYHGRNRDIEVREIEAQHRGLPCSPEKSPWKENKMAPSKECYPSSRWVTEDGLDV